MSIMSDIGSDDFPLYMSSVKVEETDKAEIIVIYEGDGTGIDNVLLIGKNNNLPQDISKATLFVKEDKVGRAAYKIAFPIWEDGSFQAVVEREGKYIYEPGEAHNIVFRGRGIFLDLRKIFHLAKEIEKTKKKTKKKEKIVIEESIPKKTEVKQTEPPAYDDYNMLTLKPKNFRIFGPELKGNLIQALDYLENDKSQSMIFDNVILPDLARSLKICINEELRASVYDVCFPVIIFIEKALILSNMIHNQLEKEESKERYKREVVDKIPEVRKTIQVTEFHRATDLIKRDYDDDIHALKMRFYEEI
ncbi:MAG: hypothetical protein E3J43_04585 [Candidatus Heimdallarchaeota archaeon]|nr:MAG: hypothetical protein E3J43_04585 [Candidatus Heimdallarchaeota archaeon]